MRIGMVAPPWLPVPPPAYGGTEAVIDGLIRGVVASGHEVVLVAHPDSSAPAEIRSVLPRGATDSIGQAATELAHVLGAYDILSDVDVIHDHTLCGPLVGAHASSTPVVVTHHGPFDDSTKRIFGRVARSASVIAISHNHAETAGDIPIAGVVHHGIDVATVPFGDGDGGYLAFLGRMVPEKGPHRAIRIAQRSGLPLLIAAKMREAPEKEFFEAEVEPLLGGEIEYIGEVDSKEKQRLLCGAKALLNPIAWPEPFGMVMLEALACGTPVVARASGAAPEIVSHGNVGFLGRSDAELVRAIPRVDNIDRLTCRTWATQRFSLELMAKGYEEQYFAALERVRAA